MLLLDSLELYMTEKSSYDLYPADFRAEDSVTYKVSDDDEDVAKIRIKMIDGEIIDGVDSEYDYSDVYADVDLDGDVNDPKQSDLIEWLLNKLSALGFDMNPININGETVDIKQLTLDNQQDDSDEELKDEIASEVDVDI